VTQDPHTPDVSIDASRTPVEPASEGDVVETGAPNGAPVHAAATDDGAPVDPAEHAEVVAQRDEYLDGLQRLKAEFDNYRRRVDRDREIAQQAGVRDLVGELLPVIDNLERAVAALEGTDGQIVAGVEMVRGQLAALLTGRGVEEIAAHAEPFDPTIHEAVAQHPTDEHVEGTVVHVAEKGYRLGDAVIRPAKVIVAAPPPEES
jgi:molecular chaperone GrpE